MDRDYASDNSIDSDFLEELSQELAAYERSSRATFGTEDEPITVSEDDDSDIEVIDMDGQPKSRIMYTSDLDEDGIEELLVRSQPKDLATRKVFSGFQCPVCMDSPDIVMVTPCGHMYCNDCGLRALSSTSKATERKGECSVCRRLFDYKQLRYLEIKLKPVAEE